MFNLREIIKNAETKKIAIGHFNISDIVALKSIFRASSELRLPVIVGVSEGERNFVGIRLAAALVKSLREEYNYPIFLNADHTYSLDGVKKVVEAGYDSVIFDGAKLPVAENIKRTKEAVEYVKSVNSDIIVEGEIGYIGTSSAILDSIPDGAVVSGEKLTSPAEAVSFVKETGVDMFAPAVGNIHGMFKGAPNPALDIERIRDIRGAVNVPLVLHGGSGITDSDFASAIEAGISIVHINTEIRLAWRTALERILKDNPNEVAPYKILTAPEKAVYETVKTRLKLFSKMS